MLTENGMLGGMKVIVPAEECGRKEAQIAQQYETKLGVKSDQREMRCGIGMRIEDNWTDERSQQEKIKPWPSLSRYTGVVLGGAFL